MRQTFINTLAELAEKDERIVFMTGDLGFTVVEPLQKKIPDRFFNVGVSEQNMLGMSTGLAEAGYLPFVYSIATFAVLRPFEFIRNGAVMHNLKLRIIGIGGGLEYGAAGTTHHSIEDIALMRTLPGMTIVSPCDAAQTKTALEQTWDNSGPVYYRLGKDENYHVPELNGAFACGEFHQLREGNDLLFVCTGSITKEVLQACDQLTQQDLHCGVTLISHIGEEIRTELKQTLNQYRRVICVEPHGWNGGLGSFIAEIIAEHQLDCKLLRKGINRTYLEKTGSEKYLLEQYGLNSKQLEIAALEMSCP